MCGGWDMGGDWSVRFGRHDGIKCYALVSGQCWLVVEGVPEPVRVAAGDCFVLPSGRPFHLTSDLALTPVDFHAVIQLPLNGAVATLNGGGDCFGVGGHFRALRAVTRAFCWGCCRRLCISAKNRTRRRFAGLWNG